MLDRVSLMVQSGQALHLQGANGAGKTTLIRLLAGFIWPEAGECRLDGLPYRDQLSHLRVQLCYLGHHNGLNADLTVTENVRHLATLSGSVDEAQLSQALAQAGLAGLADRMVRTLSAGQKRRVCLSRLMLSEHLPIWLLDEPWAHLDQAGVHWVSDLINAHTQRGGLVVFSSHNDLAKPLHGYQSVALC